MKNARIVKELEKAGYKVTTEKYKWWTAQSVKIGGMIFFIADCNVKNGTGCFCDEFKLVDVISKIKTAESFVELVKKNKVDFLEYWSSFDMGNFGYESEEYEKYQRLLMKNN